MAKEKSNEPLEADVIQFVDNEVENSIKVFNSPLFGDVRTSGTSDNPLFCLADVCKALGLRQGDVKCRLSDGLVSTQPIIDSLGRQQQANFVNEDGLYDVILDSRKPEAKVFRKWVTSEVIPSIRKTGGYIATTSEMSDEEIMSRALSIAQATIAKHQQRIQQLNSENERQQAEIERKDETISLQEGELKKAAPKVTYYDKVLDSNSLITTTKIAKNLGMIAKELNKKLEQAGIQYCQSGTWILKAPYHTWNFGKIVPYIFTLNDGSQCTKETWHWNHRGMRFVYALHEHNYNVREAINYLRGEGSNG